MHRLRSETGQSTVEYAIVLVAFLCIILALGALWKVAHSGRMLEIAREASSHNCGDGICLGLLQDVTAY